MSALGLLDHLLNFAAPALAVALLLALGARVLMQKVPGAPALWAQVAINFVVGVAVLLVGLVITGHDGRIGSYAALVIVCGTAQWALVRGWR
jgi:hypothetical protein